MNAQLCMQLGIFLEVPRTCAGSCGFLRTSRQRQDARKRPLSLSPAHSSLRPRSPEVAGSPQRADSYALWINRLRADESSGWFSASAGGGTRPDSENGECGFCQEKCSCAPHTIWSPGPCRTWTSGLADVLAPTENW